jgi:energy-converting hydrogenase B subunit D
VIGVQLVAIFVVGVTALLVVLTQDILRQALLYGIYGFTLVALFVVFQAPDVALSELAVSTIAFPLVILATLAKVKRRGDRDK